MKLVRQLMIITALLCVMMNTHAHDKQVVIPGDPPLTQEMVDDYAKLLEWRMGVSARTWSQDRLRQIAVNDWKNSDARQRNAFLAALKWWREDFPKLCQFNNHPRGQTSYSELERLRQATMTDSIQRLKLQLDYQARMQTILGINKASADGHDLNMKIIDNIRPSGRYEYNPVTGKYDRYVDR